MSYALSWLPTVLEQAGLKVARCPGWETRGVGEMGIVRGVICHHTAGSRKNNMPSLGLLIAGRPDLQGPLAQLGLARDGTYYVIAAGRCNHAGAGSWNGITTGTSSFIGIEAENTGLKDDFPWPEIQIEAYQGGVAAILRHLKLDVRCCAGHKEYAQPPGRKIDPKFDMEVFRQGVAGFMNGYTTVEPIPARGTVSGMSLPTLRRGDRGDDVRRLRAWLDDDSGFDVFDSLLEARVRTFQRDHDLVADGIVGPLTWGALAEHAQVAG
jgi:peptidoglycan hydrolase-like protein with peptidoglycan-binding domain